MENDLTIQLRVLSAGLDKVDQATKSVNNLGNAVDKASSGGFSKFSKVMESTGSRINVLGQRITFMAGLPLLALANNAINTAVDVERSFVRLSKVFSGTEEEFNRLKDASFRLSTTFGKPVEDMTEIMTEFNKAGVNSVDDLESLGKTTAQTAILFDTDLTKALTGVKSVMMGYNLTAADTEKALAAINIIGDKTTASEQGILDVFNRAAGTARQAGFSFRELAASQAVFEKNAIPAGRAGNAMKSILVSLTKQSDLAKGQFAALGVDMSSLSWRTASAGDKFKILAKKLLEVQKSGDKAKLADLNEAMASLVGKFQINNLNVLLEDMAAQFDDNASTVSMFGQALAVSNDEVENMKWQMQQLDKALQSSPMSLDILEQKYRQQQIILGKELIPLKVKLMETVLKLIEYYNKLSPETQKWVTYIGAAVIILGPLLAGLGLVVSALGFFFSTISGGLSFLGTFSSVSWQIVKLIGKGGMLGGVTALAAAWAIFTVAKAIDEFNQLQDELKENEKWLAQNAKTLDELQAKVGSLRTEDANKQLQDAINKSREADQALKDLDNRYKGLGGTLNAVGDQFSTWADKSSKSIQKVLDKYKKAKDEGAGSFQAAWDAVFKSKGGLIPEYFATGGISAISRGTDTVPAMLTPGEMVLTKGQQTRLFDMLQGRSQGSQGAGVTVNISVGNMIASRGEQREFARTIKELLDEDGRRFVTA